MNKKLGITLGGLQHKILNLVLIFILAIIGVYTAVFVYQNINLTKTVNEAAEEQQQSISSVSNKTMEATLGNSLTKSTALEADVADELFAGIGNNVMTLKGVAEEIFENADSYGARTVGPPDPALDGTTSAMLLLSEGTDLALAQNTGLVCNMSDIMRSMYDSSDNLSALYVSSEERVTLFVNDRSGEYVDENGLPLVLPDVRTRPWYMLAAEKGNLSFTEVYVDALTNVPCITCSAPVYQDGKLVAVVGADVSLSSISDYVNSSTEQGSFVCIINENGKVIFSPQTEGIFAAEISENALDLRNSEDAELAAFVTKALSENTGLETITVDNTEYYITGAPIGTIGWTVISVVEKEITRQPTVTLLTQFEQINDKSTGKFNDSVANSKHTLLVMTLALLVLATVGALVVAGRIVKPIERMTNRIHDISGTDLAFEMEDSYRTKDEIEVLAEAFAELSKRTKEYIKQITHITAEKERIGAELELATKIQADMLPNIFPAFPSRPEFDIYASMTPAKEVGGDFYDFFLIDDDHLGMVMADVSGKGVPAALFMVIAKTLLKYRSQMGGSPAEILEIVNNQLCEGNDAELFVTVWLGILEISTGKVIEANAGHEHPALCRNGQKWELVIYDHSPALAVMEDMEFEEREFYLKPGDSLYVYTDGVAEATNAENELYGNDRMVDALNQTPDAKPKKILANVDTDVQKFVGEAPQFDDLTMLCLKYYGPEGNSD